jgi:transporter family protein
MNLDYLTPALIAMTLLGVHFFLVKLLSQQVPGRIIVFFGQVIIVPVLVVYIYVTGTSFQIGEVIYLVYALLASLLLSVGIIALYVSIQKGPVSIVIPVFSLNAVVAAVLGILFLEEVVTIEKVIGIGLATAAIMLLSRS